MNTEIDNKKSSQEGEIADTTVKLLVGTMGLAGGVFLIAELQAMQIIAGLSLTAISGGYIYKKTKNKE